MIENYNKKIVFVIKYNSFNNCKAAVILCKTKKINSGRTNFEPLTSYF